MLRKRREIALRIYDYEKDPIFEPDLHVNFLWCCLGPGYWRFLEDR